MTLTGDCGQFTVDFWTDDFRLSHQNHFFLPFVGSLKEAEKQHFPWCHRWDSNSQSLKGRTILSRECIAVPSLWHILVPFTLTVSLKSGWGSWTRTNESGSQSPLPYHLAIPQYTNRFIHPTYGNRYGLRGFRRQSWISTSAYTAQRKGGFKFMRYQPHIRCNIAYTPWPSAYCPPHCTSFYLSNITSFVRPVIPLSAEHGHGPSRSLWGLWVNPFSRQPEE